MSLFRLPIAMTLALLACLGSNIESAFAYEDGESEFTPRELRSALGAGYTETSDGLYEIPLAGGKTIETHGPDTVIDTHGLPGSPDPDGTLRNPVCTGDNNLHFLYMRRPGASSGLAADSARIQSIIRAADATLNRESLASGGPNADYRVLCDSTGAPRIDELTTGANSYKRIVIAARLAGYDAPGTDYAILSDDDADFCGMGSITRDDSPLGLNINLNLAGSGYIAIKKSCWEGTLMHEIGHAQGAVQPGAPHSTGLGAHCNEEQDVMCYADGGDKNQVAVTNCADFEHFDCNYDDYFDSAPEPGEYLASHLNLGSPANASLAFGRNQPQTLTTNSLSEGAAALPDISAAPGSFHTYSFKVPRKAKRLQVSMSPYACAPSCQFSTHLYLKRGSAPTPARYTCRAAPAAAEDCRVGRPKPGRWYAGVYAGGAGGAPYSIKMSFKASTAKKSSKGRRSN